MTEKLLKKAFTLVELIIVIAIVAILAVISFLWLNKWLGNARDASRKGNLANLDKALQIYLTEKTTLPKPDNNTMLYASGIEYVIGYQGYFGETARDSVGNIDKAPKDGNNFFTYYVNSDLSKYQLMAYMENPVAYNPNTANAENYAQRYIYVRGDKLGILTDSDKNPLQNFGGTGFNILSGDRNYAAYYDNSTNIVLTGQSLISMMVLGNKNSAQFDTGLVGYWDMETTINSGGNSVLKDFSSYGNNGICYNGSGNSVNCGGQNGGPQFLQLKNGKAMQFDGINDFVKMSDIQNFLNSEEFTIIATVNLYKITLSPVFVGTERDWNGGYLQAYSKGDKFFYCYWLRLNSVSNSSYSSIINYNFNETHAIVGRYDKSSQTQDLFVDSNLIKSVERTDSFTLANKNFYIGGFGDSNTDAKNRMTNGMIDEVRIYNRALSNDEVKTLYTATN